MSVSNLEFGQSRSPVYLQSLIGLGPCKTRWASILHLTKRSSNCRQFFNYFVTVVYQLNYLEISKLECGSAEKVCTFLESASAMSEYKSEQKCVTSNLRFVLFNSLQKRCSRTAAFRGPVPTPMAQS